MEQRVGGYNGKQLRIDLKRRKVTVEAADPAVMRSYIGGAGYGAKVLYEELKKGIDPLSSKNKILFTTSPLNENRIPGGGSVMVCFKSPLTGTWSESRCGSDFGPDIRKAGFDMVIVEGRSKQPVYILIDDERVQFKPAGHITGKMVSEKTELIRKELGDEKISVMTIGPAGEKLVKIAVALCDARAAGRCGLGAVMGSKNLLAVAVRGTSGPEAANPDKLKEAIKEAMKVIKESEMAAGFKEHGTTGDLTPNDAAGDMPTKNWLSNHFGKLEKMYDNFFNNYLVRNHGCYRGCPIACGRIAEVKEGKFKTPEHEGSEYESLAAFTAYVLNDSIEAAINATYLCNEYGIDTISAGGIAAFAMECYEHGIIRDEDTGSLDLSWGNSEVLPEIVRMISLREGIGDTLAEGVKGASRKLGKGSERFAIHGKGLEAPAHDPRSGKLLALCYGTANRGMCHIHPLEGMAYDSGKIHWGFVKYGVPDPNEVERWDEQGKGKMAKVLQDGMVIGDILNICKFFMYSGLTIDHYAAMLSALTGWDIDGWELMKVGERVINLQRMFNVREGFKREDDLIPERMQKLPSFGIYEKEKRCEIHDYEKMLDEYYEARGWDVRSGVPTKEKLVELGLEL
jgi:aldehyde:ferredoxin oxidoreductase